MKKVLFFIVLSLMTVASCKKEVQVPETSLSVEKNAITFSNEGGSMHVSISVNKAWKVSASQPWCSISPSEGQDAYDGDIVVTCTPNNEYDVRSCTVTITCAEKKAELAVEQGGKDALIVPSSALTLTCEAQSVNVEVQSNIQYDVAIPEACQSWLSVESSKALSSKTYTISVAANTSYMPREGYVEFRQKGEGLSSTIIVHQEASSTPPDNEIWYTTTDGNKYDITGPVFSPIPDNGFGARIVANTYEDGWGVVKFDGSVSSVPEYAFFESTLKTIHFPNCVTSIAAYAFYSSESLMQIEIPEAITFIGNEAFSRCPALREFSGTYATADGRALVKDDLLIAFAPAGVESYSIPSGVTKINRCVFGGCSELVSVMIPDGLVNIGMGAFVDCIKLASVSLPKSVEIIDRDAFNGCSSLVSLDIPESLRSIGVYAFEGCSSLREFTGAHVSPDHRLIVFYDEIRAFAPGGITSYIIPDGIRSIGITSFTSTRDLMSVEIPNSVEYIGASAFARSGLHSLVIPESVQFIDHSAFWLCEGLESIEVLSSVPPQGAEEMFDRTYCPIYVPEAAVEAYKSAPYWSEYADRFVGRHQSQEGEDKYLTFSSSGETEIMLYNREDNAPVLYYSYDRDSWTLWDYSPLYFSNHSPLYLRGDNPQGLNSESAYSTFDAHGDLFSVSGDIMSLIDYSKDIVTIPSECCFMELFEGCDLLVSAPDLPATALTDRCYFALFAMCRSLTTAPTLPATSLARSCYEYMFYGCNQLNYMECLATSIYDSDFYPCTGGWLDGVAATGTFVKAPVMNAWPSGPHGIPEGWTVKDSETQSSDFNKYLTFTSEGYSGIIIQNIGGNAPYLEYSYDTVSWTQWDYSPIEFMNGRPLYLRGDNPNGISSSMSTYSFFASGGDSFHISGSIMALIDYSKEVTAIPCDYCFYGLFHHCDRLLTAPSLPATSLTVACYCEMFSDCINLTTAPTLPAKYLTAECYEHMFYGCTNLNYVKCLASDISAGGCTYYWLKDVAPNGTFVKASEMSNWPSGISGVPEGWTVVNAE